jgi:hypothetical protein
MVNPLVSVDAGIGFWEGNIFFCTLILKAECPFMGYTDKV